MLRRAGSWFGAHAGFAVMELDGQGGLGYVHGHGLMPMDAAEGDLLLAAKRTAITCVATGARQGRDGTFLMHRGQAFDGGQAGFLPLADRARQLRGWNNSVVAA
jgi:hypothetical protein